MTVIKLQIVTELELVFRPENYPQGFTPQQALALELEQASQDPHEYLAMPTAATAVQGRLLREPASARQAFSSGKIAARDAPH